MTIGSKTPLAPVRLAALSTLALLGSAADASAASAGAAAPKAAAVRSADPVASAPADVDGGSRNVVARARMLECGHQWSSLKKSGTASGTWKEFSRTCLAQR